MITDEMIEAGCRARHGRSWKRHSEKPDMHAWAASHRAEMRVILEAALAAVKRPEEARHAAICRSIRHHLDGLLFRSTGKDPKNTGFSYAEVPEWQLRRWLDDLEKKPLGDVLFDCLTKIGVDP